MPIHKEESIILAEHITVKLIIMNDKQRQSREYLLLSRQQIQKEDWSVYTGGLVG